mgnify:FL=1|tara:strand:+ start:624 stop:1028 length:405 start_codon:yes stop_codon:yes gene_type:complete
MKTFRDFITEGRFEGLDLRTSGKVPHDIDDADIKQMVNALLGHTAISEYLNPKAAVEQMKMKLGQMGLGLQQEEEIEFTESGEFDLNFSRYGEIMGKSVDTPIDEIEKEEKIISLKVKYEQLDNGCYKVYGSLV